MFARRLLAAGALSLIAFSGDVAAQCASTTTGDVLMAAPSSMPAAFVSDASPMVVAESTGRRGRFGRRAARRNDTPTVAVMPPSYSTTAWAGSMNSQSFVNPVMPVAYASEGTTFVTPATYVAPDGTTFVTPAGYRTPLMMSQPTVVQAQGVVPTPMPMPAPTGAPTRVVETTPGPTTTVTPSVVVNSPTVSTVPTTGTIMMADPNSYPTMTVATPTYTTGRVRTGRTGLFSRFRR